MSDIYLAGPFFNPEQIAAQTVLERLAAEWKLDVHSPRKSMVLPKDATDEQCQRVFNENLTKIEEARLVVANIEGFDCGTMVEIGYAYKARIPVVGYSFTPGRKLNVMVKQLVVGFYSSEYELGNLFAKLRGFHGSWPKLPAYKGEVE